MSSHHLSTIYTPQLPAPPLPARSSFSYPLLLFLPPLPLPYILRQEVLQCSKQHSTFYKLFQAVHDPDPGIVTSRHVQAVTGVIAPIRLFLFGLEVITSKMN